VVRPRRIAIVAVSLATASAAGWALVELGRPAEPTRVPPIVIELDRDGPVSGPGKDPGGADPEGDGDPGPDPGSGDGAEPPPAPPPPPAGDDDDDDDDDDDVDDDGGDDADD
jgi:hypothetical protein